MRKPDSLKALLLKTVPVIAKSPENLSCYVDKGRVAARATGSLSFEYRYTLNVLVEEYAGDRDALMVPVLAWIGDHQPDLLERDKREPFKFEIDFLDQDSADIFIEIELSERVRVDRQPTGVKVVHLDDAPVLDAFAGVAESARLTVGMLDDLTADTAELVP